MSKNILSAKNPAAKKPVGKNPNSEKELQQIFMQFHQKIGVAFRKEAKDMPLTIPQLEALRFVIEKKNPTMKDVAGHLHVMAPSATAMMDQLAEKKLIVRGPSSADRRSTHILPTSKALKIFSTFTEIKAKVFGKMLLTLSTNDQTALVEILKKLM